MEVHPPDHPIRNWRDFLVHIATITIGLLIAIALEGVVEFAHHKHLVHQAHRDLRNEMLANRSTLTADESDLIHVRELLLHDLQTLRALQARNAAFDATLSSEWAWEGLSESAFNTARDTGAFAYMPYDEVQDVDMLYRQQKLVGDAANTYIASVNRIRLPLQGGRTLAQASPEETNQMIQSCSAALINIGLLQSLMRSLPADYARLTAE